MDLNPKTKARICKLALEFNKLESSCKLNKKDHWNNMISYICKQISGRGIVLEVETVKEVLLNPLKPPNVKKEVNVIEDRPQDKTNLLPVNHLNTSESRANDSNSEVTKAGSSESLLPPKSLCQPRRDIVNVDSTIGDSGKEECLPNNLSDYNKSNQCNSKKPQIKSSGFENNQKNFTPEVKKEELKTNLKLKRNQTNPLNGISSKENIVEHGVNLSSSDGEKIIRRSRRQSNIKVEPISPAKNPPDVEEIKDKCDKALKEENNNKESCAQDKSQTSTTVDKPSDIKINKKGKNRTTSAGGCSATVDAKTYVKKESNVLQTNNLQQSEVLHPQTPWNQTNNQKENETNTPPDPERKADLQSPRIDSKNPEILGGKCNKSTKGDKKEKPVKNAKFVLQQLEKCDKETFHPPELKKRNTRSSSSMSNSDTSDALSVANVSDIGSSPPRYSSTAYQPSSSSADQSKVNALPQGPERGLDSNNLDHVEDVPTNRTVEDESIKVAKAVTHKKIPLNMPDINKPDSVKGNKHSKPRHEITCESISNSKTLVDCDGDTHNNKISKPVKEVKKDKPIKEAKVMSKQSEALKRGATFHSPELKKRNTRSSSMSNSGTCEETSSVDNVTDNASPPPQSTSAAVPPPTSSEGQCATDISLPHALGLQKVEHTANAKNNKSVSLNSDVTENKGALNKKCPTPRKRKQSTSLESECQNPVKEKRTRSQSLLGTPKCNGVADNMTNGDHNKCETISPEILGINDNSKVEQSLVLTASKSEILNGGKTKQNQALDMQAAAKSQSPNTYHKTKQNQALDMQRAFKSESPIIFDKTKLTQSLDIQAAANNQSPNTYHKTKQNQSLGVEPIAKSHRPTNAGGKSTWKGQIFDNAQEGCSSAIDQNVARIEKLKKEVQEEASKTKKKKGPARMAYLRERKRKYDIKKRMELESKLATNQLSPRDLTFSQLRLLGLLKRPVGPPDTNASLPPPSPWPPTSNQPSTPAPPPTPFWQQPPVVTAPLNTNLIYIPIKAEVELEAPEVKECPKLEVPETKMETVDSQEETASSAENEPSSSFTDYFTTGRAEEDSPLLFPFKKIKLPLNGPQTPPMCSFEDVMPILDGTLTNETQVQLETPTSTRRGTDAFVEMDSGDQQCSYPMSQADLSSNLNTDGLASLGSGLLQASPPLSPGMVYPDTPRSSRPTPSTEPTTLDDQHKSNRKSDQETLLELERKCTWLHKMERLHYRKYLKRLQLIKQDMKKFQKGQKQELKKLYTQITALSRSKNTC